MPDTLINLSFTEGEINLVLHALSTRPYAEVAQLIQRLRAEGQAQIDAAEQRLTEAQSDG